MRKGPSTGMRSDKVILAERKNKIENVRLDTRAKILEKEQYKVTYLINKEKRIVSDTTVSLVRTTGKSDVGLKPEGKNDRQVKSSQYFRFGSKISDRRLYRWKDKEKSLKKFIRTSETAMAVNDALVDNSNEQRDSSSTFGDNDALSGDSQSEHETIISARTSSARTCVTPRRDSTQPDVFGSLRGDLGAMNVCNHHEQEDGNNNKKQNIKNDKLSSSVDDTNRKFPLHTWEKVILEQYKNRVVDSISKPMSILKIRPSSAQPAKSRSCSNLSAHRPGSAMASFKYESDISKMKKRSNTLSADYDDTVTKKKAHLRTSPLTLSPSKYGRSFSFTNGHHLDDISETVNGYQETSDGIHNVLKPKLNNFVDVSESIEETHNDINDDVFHDDNPLITRKPNSVAKPLMKLGTKSFSKIDLISQSKDGDSAGESTDSNTISNGNVTMSGLQKLLQQRVTNQWKQYASKNKCDDIDQDDTKQLKSDKNPLTRRSTDPMLLSVVRSAMKNSGRSLTTSALMEIDSDVDDGEDESKTPKLSQWKRHLSYEAPPGINLDHSQPVQVRPIMSKADRKRTLEKMVTEHTMNVKDLVKNERKRRLQSRVAVIMTMVRLSNAVKGNT